MASVEYEAIPTISINGPEDYNGEVSDEHGETSSPDPVVPETLMNHVDESSDSEENTAPQSVDSDIDKYAQNIVDNVLLSSIANMYVDKILENVKNGILNGDYPEFKSGLTNGDTSITEESMEKSRVSISDEDEVCIDSDNSDHVNDSMSALLEEQRERLGEDMMRNEAETAVEKLRAQDSTDVEDVGELAKPTDIQVIVDDKLGTENSNTEKPDTEKNDTEKTDTKKIDNVSSERPEGLLAEPVCPVTTNLIPATPEKESIGTSNDDSVQDHDKISQDTPTDKNEEEGAKPRKPQPQEIPKENAARAKKKKKRMSSFRKLFTCCAAGKSTD